MKAQKNVLEWVVFAVSAVLIAAVLGILIFTGAQSGDTPPLLVVETEPPQRAGEIFRVPVRVRNTGDETAEQSLIEVELTDGGTVVERAELAFPYVPKRSSREGWVEFHRDPKCCVLTARASFSAP